MFLEPVSQDNLDFFCAESATSVHQLLAKACDVLRLLLVEMLTDMSVDFRYFVGISDEFVILFFVYGDAPLRNDRSCTFVA